MAEPKVPDESVDLSQNVNALPARGRSIHDPCPGLSSAQWAAFGALSDTPPVWFFVRERDAVLMPFEQFKRLALLAGHVLNTPERTS